MEFDFTPMIDLVFTLSMFYMLVSRFHSAEQSPMLIPKPEQSQAHVTKIPDKVVINCGLSEAADGEAVYSLGANPPEPLETIAERLAGMKQQSADLKVVVRADRRLPFAQVRSVMEVLARHQIEMLNVAALAGEGD